MTTAPDSSAHRHPTSGPTPGPTADAAPGATLDAALDAVLGAVSAGATPWAGGTDLMARTQQGRPATGPFAELGGVPELHGVTTEPDGSVRIGAMTTVAELAGDLAGGYPALAAAAGALATPQVRAVGTVGGNLLQRNRCAYLRNPAFDCHQTGGDGCPARSGLPRWPVAVDLSPCIAPHPSSLAVALLAYDAEAELHPRGRIPLAELYGDGADPTRDHRLAGDEVLLAVRLPAARPAERAAHRRTTEHDRAEWPQVEAVARLTVEDGTIGFAAVAVGGVARTPLRLPTVEAALTGRPATAEALAAAAGQALAGRSPLPKAGYKTRLLEATLLDVLEQALPEVSAGH